MERLRFIDGDSHVLEPEAIWEDYLEKKYRHLINGHVRWVTAPSGNGVNAVDESSTRYCKLGRTSPSLRQPSLLVHRDTIIT